MLKQQIQKDINEALKKGSKIVSETLRMAISSINLKEKEKRYKISKRKPELSEEDLIKESALTDEEIIDSLSSEIKKRNDAIALYEKGNRQELADKEKEEISFLKKYLPEQLSEQELRKIIEESISKTGAFGIKDMGKVMADLAPKTKGRADASEISGIVKELLS
ncbi:MAG: GatB/YqeY domain-containing protein [Candidatus Staskawiczbacteria bacterium]|nr:GatB/YqeY domain-containing protein [Candidatus Staskawiczbacteria bacterium]